MKLEGFLVVLTIVLLGLKLFAGLAITWFWVFAPLILLAVIAVISFIILLIVLAVAKEELANRFIDKFKDDK